MAVFTVTTLSDVTAADGETTLREALTLANGSAGADQIVFANGLQGTVRLVQGALSVSDDVSISGNVNGAGAAVVTLNGLGADRVFNIASGDADIDSFRVVGGYAATGGGGILVAAGASLDIDNSTVANNRSNGGYGGGIYSNGGTVEITDSTISVNRADYSSGGAVSVRNGVLEVSGTTLGGNTAAYSGGAIDARGSSVSIESSFLVNNRAPGEYGGAVRVSGGTTTISTTTISSNTAAYGGGLAVTDDATATLINTTVARNTAAQGGGAYFSGAGFELVSSTVAGNLSTGIAGGIYAGVGRVDATNSIIFGNAAAGSFPNHYGGLAVTGGGVINGSVFQDGSVTGTTTVEEVFANVSDGRAALSSAGGPGPIIALAAGGDATEIGDASLLPADTFDLDGDGNASEPLPLDAKGEVRIAGQLLDVGAAEVVRSNVFGTSAADLLVGEVQAETFFGRSGNDTLRGEGGDDTLLGGGGGDILDGGAGFDTSSYDDATARVRVDLLGGLSSLGFAVGDTFSSIEGLIGSDFNDDLRGDNVDNVVAGGAGRDRISGRGGDDTLDGGDGNDVLIGNAGQDGLTGGAGIDRFVFFDTTDSERGAQSRDIITDFVAGQDRIDLRTIDADTGTGGDQAFTFVGTSASTNTAGELRVSQSAVQNITLLRADVDGDGLDDFQIELTGLIDISASDFLL